MVAVGVYVYLVFLAVVSVAAHGAAVALEEVFHGHPAILVEAF